MPADLPNELIPVLIASTPADGAVRMIQVPATVMLMRKISECELRITRAENIAAQQRAKSRNAALRADRATAAQLVASLEESIAWLKV